MTGSYSNPDSARRAAVSKAWANERALIQEGRGTRDWSKAQQAEILAAGRCKGYIGHHKCSVKNNPELAGDPKNIQFLTFSEHIKAHGSNFKNDPHGRYDTETGELVKYADGKVQAEPVKVLSEQISADRKKSALQEYERIQAQKRDRAKQDAAERAKNYSRRSSSKRTAQDRRGEAARSRQTHAKTSQALQVSRSNAGRPGKGASPQSQSLASRSAAPSAGSSSSGKNGHSAGVSSGGSHGGTGGPGHGGRGGHGGH